jgi:hypothetical protein
MHTGIRDASIDAAAAQHYGGNVVERQCVVRPQGTARWCLPAITGAFSAPTVARYWRRTAPDDEACSRDEARRRFGASLGRMEAGMALQGVERVHARVLAHTKATCRKRGALREHQAGRSYSSVSQLRVICGNHVSIWTRCTR